MHLSCASVISVFYTAAIMNNCHISLFVSLLLSDACFVTSSLTLLLHVCHIYLLVNITELYVLVLSLIVWLQLLVFLSVCSGAYCWNYDAAHVGHVDPVAGRCNATC